MFPDELEAACSAHPVVYLPYGLYEPHGPHNAVGMDALRAHSACCIAAKTHGGIVAPPFYWHIHEIGGYGSWAEERIGDRRPWLTAYPPWMFFKSLLYHIRAADMLELQAAILFSGHSGPMPGAAKHRCCGPPIRTVSICLAFREPPAVRPTSLWANTMRNPVDVRGSRAFGRSWVFSEPREES